MQIKLLNFNAVAFTLLPRSKRGFYYGTHQSPLIPKKLLPTCSLNMAIHTNLSYLELNYLTLARIYVFQ